MTGRVEAVFLAVARGEPMCEVAEAEALLERGLAGCRHAEREPHPMRMKRQVLLLDATTPPALGLLPGALKENLLVAGLPLEDLPNGQRLGIGEAVLEITMTCVPCQRLNTIRPGLLKEGWGRRGQLARVVRGGVIRVGDAVTLLDVNPHATPKLKPRLP